jgi:hypothetical protein
MFRWLSKNFCKFLRAFIIILSSIVERDWKCDKHGYAERRKVRLNAPNFDRKIVESYKALGMVQVPLDFVACFGHNEVENLAQESFKALNSHYLHRYA